MITLTRKKKEATTETSKRISIRDFLLVKEVQELEQSLPGTCKVIFNDPNILSEFTMVITPSEGFWCGGKFKFNVHVPEEYNMCVSISRYSRVTLEVNLFFFVNSHLK